MSTTPAKWGNTRENLEWPALIILQIKSPTNGGGTAAAEPGPDRMLKLAAYADLRAAPAQRRDILQDRHVVARLLIEQVHPAQERGIARHRDGVLFVVA